MKIPDKVKILYKNYKVIQQENLHDKDCELYGQIRYMDEVIAINPNSSEEQQKASIIHELIHGIDDLYGINLKEKQVEILGVALYAAIIDNPEIFSGGGEID